MTIQEMIRNHRALWNWIADETERRKRCVLKFEYFKEHGEDIPICECYACEYVFQEIESGNFEGDGLFPGNDCVYCPLQWTTDTGVTEKRTKCTRSDSLYFKWVKSWTRNDYKNASEYARMIANMPLTRKGDVQDDN